MSPASEPIEQSELACLGYPRAAAPLVDRRLRVHEGADEPVGELGGIDRPKKPEEIVDLDAMDEHPGQQQPRHAEAKHDPRDILLGPAGGTCFGEWRSAAPW